jgi:hypothetical protein
MSSCNPTTAGHFLSTPSAVTTRRERAAERQPIALATVALGVFQVVGARAHRMAESRATVNSCFARPVGRIVRSADLAQLPRDLDRLWSLRRCSYRVACLLLIVFKTPDPFNRQ